MLHVFFLFHYTSDLFFEKKSRPSGIFEGFVKHFVMVFKPVGCELVPWECGLVGTAYIPLQIFIQKTERSRLQLRCYFKTRFLGSLHDFVAIFITMNVDLLNSHARLQLLAGSVCW